MTAEIADVQNRLVSSYREGHTLALFFDYDGTLTPIVEHPSSAVLAPSTRRTLSQLAAFPRVCVGVFSGRSLADLKQIVAIPDLFYCGTSGLELEYRGIPRTHAELATTTGLMTEVGQRLCTQLSAYAGAWLETKPFGLTIHFRQVDPHQIAALQSDVARVLDPFSAQVRVWPGPMAIELIPELGWDKGTAVRLSASIAGDNCTVLYAGDHANDTEAFAVVGAMNGITVGIGPDVPQSAQYRLESPIQLQRFMFGLEEALRIGPMYHE